MTLLTSKPKGWRDGQVLFNFLIWLRLKGHVRPYIELADVGLPNEHNFPSDMADTFNVEDAQAGPSLPTVLRGAPMIYMP